MELINLFMQYVVVPVSGLVIYLLRGHQLHSTEIAVLKKEVDLNKISHEREIAEGREMFNKIFAKLDSIEQALRK